MTRAEMAARAAELRKRGMLLREIAAELGISTQWASELCTDPEGKKIAARRKRYQGACLACGKPTTGSLGPSLAPTHCVQCAPRMAAKWSEEKIVSAIQRWVALYGEPPAAMEWNPAQARHDGISDVDRIEIRFERGDWPSTTSVINTFGSWNRAIQAAGFHPRNPGHRGPGDRLTRYVA